MINKQIFIDKGKLISKEVPGLTPKKGEIIVDVFYSAFSSGTEFGEIVKSSKNLLERARKSPEKISKAIEMFKTMGIKSTINFIQDSQLSLNATGYSSTGIVSSIGKGINDLAVGDLVACSGAQYAHHAFQIKVSRQLCVKINNKIPLSLASTVTLGSIAMQGVRQAKVTLGERVLVIGLGVIGQITCQILLASGANVTGLDLDKKKLLLASECGVQNVFNPTNLDLSQRILELTEGYGYDKVIICSNDNSSSSIKTAFELARHRATVVMVGGIGLNIDRRLMYYKELKFVASMSYGPGRYDRNYEEKGLDLPISYIRWSENRNMSSYLDVVNNRKKEFENLIGKIIDFDNAIEYLNSEKSKNVDKPLIIIKYPKLNNFSSSKSYNLEKQKNKKLDKDIVNLGIVGAGGFVKNFILPTLSKIKKSHILVLASNDTASLVNMRDKYNIKLSVSNINEVLKEDIDGVIIANRHSEHFDCLKKSLFKYKNIFVEKPTVSTKEELNELIDILNSPKFNQLQIFTGYNRSFSPHIKFTQDQLKNMNSPIIMSYQMNVGLLKNDNWQYDIEEGGGRNIGEAVHIYHLFGKLFNSKVKTLSVTSLGGDKIHKLSDNFIVTLRYENGCVGSLNYTSLGSTSFPKESFIIHSGGKTIVSENYKKTQVIEGQTFKTALSEKGHKELLQTFINSISTGAHEMSREEQIETMKIAFFVENELRNK